MKTLTKEHIEKMVNTRKERDNFKSPRKGKTYEELYGIEKANKWKLKQSLALKGKPKSEEHRKKIEVILRERGKNRLGKTIEEIHGEKKAKEILGKMIKNHKGMTGRKMSKEHKEKLSSIHKLIKHNEDWNKNVSKGLIGYKHNKEFKDKARKRQLGKKPSKESRRRMSINNPRYFLGKHFSEEHKAKLKKARALQIVPMIDTKIEIKIQDYLKKLQIGFFTHYYCLEITHAYQCDIFIPVQRNRSRFISQPIIIECDGDWWHGESIKYPIPNKMQLEQQEEDNIRTQELEVKGFRVIRLWEKDIKIMELNKFKELL